ncbi:PaaI family thioesterase [Pedobacter miscanthi]|uniref:Thioesterase n=1 Tax=Pedobacter miscanthi TaxID=2259170 RepID=A0A366LC55_9SPHI|nr:PaaI family thioesterase [Pedobacter miscanthi]RBQ11477.1 thioesterase [Pedobacter miscanthi]
MKLSIIDYLNRLVNKTLKQGMQTSMRYPTPISLTLGMDIKEIGMGTAIIEIETSTELHGNQQGTIHGGLITELADAAMGTAHSTLILEDESFTSIELKINFYRPVFNDVLRAKVRPLQNGKSISHYICEITRGDGKMAAIATSTIMTLAGEKAIGR